MCLAIYAKKCGIEFERLKKDAEELREQFDRMTVEDDNHFTQKDVRDALEAYRDEFCTMPINSIVHFSGIPIEKNKRNGRKQADHIKLMNKMRDLKIELGELSENWQGRKSAQETVFIFLAENQYITAREFCERTGLAKRTFYKYKKIWLELMLEKLVHRR